MRIPESQSPAPSSREGNRANEIGAVVGTGNCRDNRAACVAQESAIPTGRFQKNSREVIRAELRTFKGVQLADLRVMALANTVELPTKSGFSIRVEQLPELAELVARALAEARARVVCGCSEVPP
jgi:hypothetical protein